MESHRLCANTLRALAMDAVQAADSGHPGMPMGMADVATVLWTRFLTHDPSDPAWPDRDRFVLSAGHGSTLLYGLLHLSGYDLPLDEIRRFRQWGSKTPGHPEVGHTAGVETTTGPLGQGFANGVGMAIAERWLRETFGPELCDHWIYAIVSDGDLMEGVASEAASLAGHLRLGRLVYLYDDNRITIDGTTDLSFGEDRMARFAAYGWHAITVDGHDPDAIAAAIAEARADARPSLICCRTIIGKGSAIEGTSKTHGAPLGADEVAATKRRLGLDPETHFVIPEPARACFSARAAEGRRAHRDWRERFEAHPRRGELQACLDRGVPEVEWPTFKGSVATRKASQACLKAIIAKAPWVVGGSADLAGSNGTEVGTLAFTGERFAGAGTIHFGVREHGMASIANGMALHGGVLPYVATFLVFHDYMRPAVRLSCLMGTPVIYLYSHDSIFLGEDGPTHQPVETLLALRSIPGMQALRPGDAAETVECWKLALARTDGPTAILLTRQNLPVLDRSRLGPASGTSRGGYVLHDVDDPDVVLIGTGSEVATALDAQRRLAEAGVRTRVVSMPGRELFLAQDAFYRGAVLPPGVPRVSIEAAVTLGWERVIGETGLAIGIDTFGASAPAEVLAEQFGLTGALIAERVRHFLGR